MSHGYTAPEFQLDAFSCPLCGAYAHFTWYPGAMNTGRGYWDGSTFEAVCSRCQKSTVWLRETKSMIWPNDVGNAPLPNPDMPEDIKTDYVEARSICNTSPRGAAALLRLAIQKLCGHLGETGKNINDDIGEMVKKGLPVEIKQALDVVRVTGNNAVHPGKMQLDDDTDTVNKLFHLVNLIVNNRITQPKLIGQLHSSLPQGALDGIKQRDANSGQTTT